MLGTSLAVGLSLKSKEALDRCQKFNYNDFLVIIIIIGLDVDVIPRRNQNKIKRS